MGNSKYTYDQFLSSAQPYLARLNNDDWQMAKANPDVGMSLLGFLADYDRAVNAGDQAAAQLARMNMKGLRGNYSIQSAAAAPAVSAAENAPSAVDAQGTVNGKAVTNMMKYLVGDTSKQPTDFNDDGKYNAKDVTGMMKGNVANVNAQSKTPGDAVAPEAEALPSKDYYNGKDVTNLMKYLVGDESKPAYDFNGDGKINAKDVIAMMKGVVANVNEQSKTSGADQMGDAVTPDAGPGEAPGEEDVAADPAAAAESKYKSLYSQLLDEYLNGGGINVEDSDLYQAYAKQYRREAQRGAEDFLGRLAAVAGGRVSTGATSAAAQQYNYYMSKLADRYPEIYEALRNEQLQKLSLIRDAEQTEYDRAFQEAKLAAQYGDPSGLERLGIDASRYFEDQEYQKEVERAVLAAQWGDTSKLRAIGVDTTQYDKDRAYERERTRWNDLLSDALAFAQFGDYSKLKEIGVDTARYESDLEYQKKVDQAVLAAQYGDTSKLSALGIDTTLVDYQNERSQMDDALTDAVNSWKYAHDASGLASIFGVPASTIEYYLDGYGTGTETAQNNSTRTIGSTKSVTYASALEELSSDQKSDLSALKGAGDWGGIIDYLDALTFLDEDTKAAIAENYGVTEAKLEEFYRKQSSKESGRISKGITPVYNGGGQNINYLMTD